MKHLFHIHTISLKSISLKKSPWFRLTLNCILIFSSPRVLCKTSSSPELETPPFPFCHQNYSEIYIMLFFLATFFLLSTSHYILYYKSWAQIFLSIFEKCWEVLKRIFKITGNTSHVAILDIQTNHFIWFKTPDSSTVLKYIGFPSIFSKLELSQRRLKSFLGQPALQTDHPWDTGGATALIHRTQISHKPWCWAAQKS